MPRFITRLAPLHGTQSVRLTVTWRKANIRRVRLDYAQPHLLRRMWEALKS